MKNFFLPTPLRSYPHRGATMLEFTLVAGVVFFFLLSLVDFSRFFFARAILFKGAQMGLSLAKNVQDFSFDLQDTNLEPADYDKRKAAFVSARDRIVERTLSLPASTMFTVGQSPSQSSFLQAYYNYPLREAGQSLNFNAPVIILRPGDSVQVEGQWIDHPDVCSADSPTCDVAKQRYAGESMENLYKNYPIIIELRSRFQFFTPAISPVLIVARAAGYKEFLQKMTPSNIPTALITPTTAHTTTTTTEPESEITTTTETTLPEETTTSTLLNCPQPPPNCEALILQYNASTCQCEPYDDTGG